MDLYLVLNDNILEKFEEINEKIKDIILEGRYIKSETFL